MVKISWGQWKKWNRIPHDISLSDTNSVKNRLHKKCDKRLRTLVKNHYKTSHNEIYFHILCHSHRPSWKHERKVVQEKCSEEFGNEGGKSLWYACLFGCEQTFGRVTAWGQVLLGFSTWSACKQEKKKDEKKKREKVNERKGQDLPQSSMSLCDIQVNIRMFHESHEVEGKETSGRCSQCKNADTVAFSTQQLQANKAFHVGFKKSWSDYHIALQRTCLFLHSDLLYCCNISKFFTLFLKSN